MATFVKGLEKVITNLIYIKMFLISEMCRNIIERSFSQISKRANELLDSRLTYAPNSFGTNVREWEMDYKTITSKDGSISYVGTLRNKYENSASVEFGIGIIGWGTTNYQGDMVETTSGGQYEYDVPSKSKTLFGWNFIDQNGKIWVNFNGYQGKSFLYDSLMEFYQSNAIQPIVRQEFDRFMKKIVGKK